jgi:hypothetical protein
MREQDPIQAARAVKRTETLLRDARAVLRRVDVLAATALAVDDPGSPTSPRSATPPTAWSPSWPTASRSSSAGPATPSAGCAEVSGPPWGTVGA